jgi:hypothetical protein
MFSKRCRSCGNRRFEADARKALLAFGYFRDDELDAYFAPLREIKHMELMNLGDHDISDDTLKATGFTAV